jgi:hypothetical protein
VLGAGMIIVGFILFLCAGNRNKALKQRNIIVNYYDNNNSAQKNKRGR